MFRSAALKLTLWYLCIIMIISIVFSLSLYRVSSSDLGHNVRRQIGYFNNILAPDESVNYRSLRNSQLNDDLDHLKANLVFFNILVLLGGGAASYWLARRTLEPIEEALDSQTRFASDASHELRTPLTAIQAENEVALRSKNLTKSQAVGVIKSNLEEVAKLKALSEGLLRLANNSNGKLENPLPVPLKEIVSAAVSRFDKQAGAKRIGILDKTTRVDIAGDKDSLLELLAIFLDNAIKYSPPGSEVSISNSTNNKTVAIKVADKGCGIKQTDLPHIFERFYRTDSSRTKNSEGGYGLGLAIAKKITDAHQGHIEVSSSVNKGTMFTVFLPTT
jgi:two-component system, OmpR family, sensor histidine kinase CiaH